MRPDATPPPQPRLWPGPWSGWPPVGNQIMFRGLRSQDTGRLAGPFMPVVPYMCVGPGTDGGACGAGSGSSVRAASTRVFCRFVSAASTNIASQDGYAQARASPPHGAHAQRLRPPDLSFHITPCPQHRLIVMMYRLYQPLGRTPVLGCQHELLAYYLRKLDRKTHICSIRSGPMTQYWRTHAVLRPKQLLVAAVD